MSWASLALDTARRLIDLALSSLKRPEPKVPPHPLPRDLLHIDRQIQSATRRVEPYTVGDALGLPRAASHCRICGTEHMGDCPTSHRSLTPREDRIIEATSPRAITTRHCIPPPRPPRKPRQGSQ